MADEKPSVWTVRRKRKRYWRTFLELGLRSDSESDDSVIEGGNLDEEIHMNDGEENAAAGHVDALVVEADFVVGFPAHVSDDLHVPILQREEGSHLQNCDQENANLLPVVQSHASFDSCNQNHLIVKHEEEEGYPLSEEDNDDSHHEVNYQLPALQAHPHPVVKQEGEEEGYPLYDDNNENSYHGDNNQLPVLQAHALPIVKQEEEEGYPLPEDNYEVDMQFLNFDRNLSTPHCSPLGSFSSTSSAHSFSDTENRRTSEYFHRENTNDASFESNDTEFGGTHPVSDIVTQEEEEEEEGYPLSEEDNDDSHHEINNQLPVLQAHAHPIVKQEEEEEGYPLPEDNYEVDMQFLNFDRSLSTPHCSPLGSFSSTSSAHSFSDTENRRTSEYFHQEYTNDASFESNDTEFGGTHPVSDNDMNQNIPHDENSNCASSENSIEEDVSSSGEEDNPVDDVAEEAIFNDFVNGDDPEFGNLLEFFKDSTDDEAFAIVLAIFIRDNLTYECVIRIMGALNFLLGKKSLPSTKKEFFTKLQRDAYGVKKIIYCSNCQAVLGESSNFQNGEIIVCACQVSVKKKKASYFAVLDLKYQFSTVLKRVDAARLLSYRDHRNKRKEGGIEDIFDGTCYRRLQSENGPLSSRFSFSYTFNTDGVSLSDSSNLQAWPVLLRWNELPPNIRQKYMFMSLLWVDKIAPDMTIFMDYFVQQANELSATGIAWAPVGQEVIQSVFIPTCCVADSKARCVVVNMQPPTGYNGCTFCTHSGLYRSGVKFPILPPVPLPERRTHEMIVNDMLQSFNEGRTVRGVNGMSPLVNLHHFDLGTGFSTDDLHPIYEGAIKFHTSLLLESATKDYYIGSPRNIGIINQRMSAIKTPTYISRKCRGITHYKKYKGSEWRNWLLYYLLPCVKGLFKYNYYYDHLQYLVRAVYLLSQKSVSENDLREAARCIWTYQTLFERYFGSENMKFNIHVLSHLVDCVRAWGPLWTHTTFTFESWNYLLARLFKSPKGIVDQITTRFLAHAFITNLANQDGFPEQAKLYIEEILHGKKAKKWVKVGDVYVGGIGKYRRATNFERALISENNFDADYVTEFDQVLLHSVEYRSTSYQYGNDECKSDNSQVYTNGDDFGCIQSIIKFDDRRSDRAVVAAVVSVYNTRETLTIAKHIAQVSGGAEVNPVLILISLQEICCHAVKVETNGNLQFIPITSMHEVD